MKLDLDGIHDSLWRIATDSRPVLSLIERVPLSAENHTNPIQYLRKLFRLSEASECATPAGVRAERTEHVLRKGVSLLRDLEMTLLSGQIGNEATETEAGRLPGLFNITGKMCSVDDAEAITECGKKYTHAVCGPATKQSLKYNGAATLIPHPYAQIPGVYFFNPADIKLVIAQDIVVVGDCNPVGTLDLKVTVFVENQP